MVEARGDGWVGRWREAAPFTPAGDTPRLGGCGGPGGGAVSKKARAWDSPCLTCWGRGHAAVGDTGLWGDLAEADPGPTADSRVTPSRSRKPSGLSFCLCTQGTAKSPLGGRKGVGEPWGPRVRLGCPLCRASPTSVQKPCPVAATPLPLKKPAH